MIFHDHTCDDPVGICTCREVRFVVTGLSEGIENRLSISPDQWVLGMRWKKVLGPNLYQQ
jgi:hypothetical protein